MGITQPASVARNRDKASFSKLSEIKGHEVFRVDSIYTVPPKNSMQPIAEVLSSKNESKTQPACGTKFFADQRNRSGARTILIETKGAAKPQFDSQCVKEFCRDTFALYMFRHVCSGKS